MMKKIIQVGILVPVLFFLGLTMMLNTGCKEEETITKPVLASFLVSDVSPTSVACGGEVISDGGSEVTARGVCWGIRERPLVLGQHTLDGAGTGTFTSLVTELLPNWKYYLRAYATNSAGTSYSNEMAFTTLNEEQISDADGNIYNTIKLGSQTWMTSDLRTTKFNDSTIIPTVRGVTRWSEIESAAYCWYDNDSIANKESYGALYNWYAVNSGKICPIGWHIPSDEEWKTLEMFLGMTRAMVDDDGFRGTDQGEQLRNLTGWNILGSSSNSSGFSAMPGGARDSTGTFKDIGDGNNWWSSTGIELDYAWKRGLHYSNFGVFRGVYNKNNGYSVRCIKD